MAHKTLRSLAVILALLVSACGTTGKPEDETVGWSAQRIYAEAKDSMADGAYDRAVTLFEKLEARYPFGPYAQQAQLEVAYAYYKSGEQASALAACDRFIRLHPGHPNVDYVYYLKGLISFNEDLGLLGALSNQDLSERDPKAAKEAFDTFKELVTRFPESRYADDAKQRMVYLVNALASHEVHVARYYYKRGGHVAAIARAQAAIKGYPNSPAQEEALFILVKSYDALGMAEQRDAANRVMQANFPNSRYYSGLTDRSKPWWQLW